MNEETETKLTLVKLQAAYPESPLISIDVKHVLKGETFKKEYFVYVFFERGCGRKAALGIGNTVESAVADMEFDRQKMEKEGVL